MGPLGEDDEYYPSLLPERSASGKTTGIMVPDEGAYLLQSGKQGPAAQIPLGTSGFSGYSKWHVEGHASAIMRQEGISEATLYINNIPCRSCRLNLRYMLPSEAKLRVVGPEGFDMTYYGVPK